MEDRANGEIQKCSLRSHSRTSARCLPGFSVLRLSIVSRRNVEHHRMNRREESADGNRL